MSGSTLFESVGWLTARHCTPSRIDRRVAPGPPCETDRVVSDLEPALRLGLGPVLVGCGHGTRVPAGRRAMAEFRLAIAKARPGLEIRAAQVDVHKPALDDVVAELAGQGRSIVVVPLLLSTGYHVKVDIARAVESAGGLAVAAAALGPDPVLVEVLTQRLAECGAGAGDPVVLAAAGSSDPQAGTDVEQIAAALSARRGSPVTIGYLASARPTVSEAVQSARAEHPGRSIAIATYLLAPGYFSSRLEQADADRVAAPLAPHPDLAHLALTRFDQVAVRLQPH
jgi:sirohydrochlorin ferrochelatase